MALITRQAQAGNTWRINAADTGAPTGRMWTDEHSARFVRDGTLAQEIQVILDKEQATQLPAEPTELSAASRRTDARAALARWETAGGRVVDLTGMTPSLLNDGGVPDSNAYFYVGGSAIGYFHGPEPGRVNRAQRCIRLAEEMWAAERLGTQNQRNTALDAALNKFRDTGGLAMV